MFSNVIKYFYFIRSDFRDRHISGCHPHMSGRLDHGPEQLHNNPGSKENILTSNLHTDEEKLDCFVTAKLTVFSFKTSYLFTDECKLQQSTCFPHRFSPDA
jgi:hypothetical protein